MKLIYTNENLILVGNVKNILEAQGFATTIKNQFAQGAIGEISAFDSWPQLWVNSTADYERALIFLRSSSSNDQIENWICSVCLEENGAAFELCWQCQKDRNQAD